MEKNKHIPWYLKNPNSFGSIKVKLLCMIAKKLLGNNIFVRLCIAKAVFKLNIKAKDFNNKGYYHSSPLSYIAILADYSNNPSIKNFFEEVNSYYPPTSRNWFRNIERRKLYNMYNSKLSWYNICTTTKNDLKKILDEFKSEIIKIK